MRGLRLVAGHGLLGRDAELAVLGGVLARVLRTGESGVVLVRGEPGIGKSTLLKAFIEAVPSVAAGRTVLVGYGQSMTNSLGSDAFQAIRECLRSLVSTAERSRSRETLTRVAQAFRQNAPDWLESVPMVGRLLAAGARTGLAIVEAPAPGEQLRSRLDQLTALICDLFASGPVVLVLDDLHWADGATIDVLMALALKVQGPLLLVLAYRPDDLRPLPGGEPHPLVRAVFRLCRYRSDCQEIDLGRLSESDTWALIEAVDGVQRLAEVEVARLVVQSGGVPLYAESLAVVTSRADGCGRAGDPPREIAAVMEERLSFAAAEDQRLLEVAVVVGFTFEVQFVAQLARMDLDDVYDRLDRILREHHLIVEAEPWGDLDRYALYHPMLGEVLRRRAGANAARWRRLHQRLVDILLGRSPSDELAVRAAQAAVAARDPRAGALALDAAQRQYAAGAVDKAHELAGIAAERTRGSALFFDVAELLARTLCVRANHWDAAELCGHALAQADAGAVSPSRIRELTLRQVRSLRMTNQWDRAERRLCDLEAQLSAGDTAVRAEIVMLRAEAALCGPVQDTSRCIELVDRVAALATDPELVSRAFGHRGLAHLAAYEPDLAQEWLDRAIAVARERGHPYAEYEAVHWLSKKKMACLELDDAWALLERLAATSQASGVASDNPFHCRDAARVHSLKGDAESAATTFVEFVELTEHRDLGRALTVLACQIHELEELHGRAVAEASLEVIRQRSAGPVSGGPLPALHAAVTRLQRRAGTWQALEYATGALGVDPDQARAAEAIFRFDVADLRRLRLLVGAL